MILWILICAFLFVPTGKSVTTRDQDFNETISFKGGQNAAPAAPPAAGAPPAAEVPPANLPPPSMPPSGGPPEAGMPPPGTPRNAGPYEIIFPTLRAWDEDLIKRAGLLNNTIIIQKGVDDEEVSKSKREAQEAMKQISNRLFDPRFMDNKNQRVIANQLGELEEKMTNIGRKLFGIRWNTTPCGAGFVQTNCGRMLPCGP